jgi:hypothetical protein
VTCTAITPRSVPATTCTPGHRQDRRVEHNVPFRFGTDTAEQQRAGAEVIGAFALEDEVRPEARQAIAQLREQGVQKAGPWRSAVYRVPGRFAHPADVPRFVSDLRSVL